MARRLIGLPGWDVAVAVELERADQPGSMLAAFCRGPMNTSSEWAWRYGVSEEEPGNGLELFDDIESFLKWFATYGVMTEEVSHRACPVFINWPEDLKDRFDGQE